MYVNQIKSKVKYISYCSAAHSPTTKSEKRRFDFPWRLKLVFLHSLGGKWFTATDSVVQWWFHFYCLSEREWMRADSLVTCSAVIGSPRWAHLLFLFYFQVSYLLLLTGSGVAGNCSDSTTSHRPPSCPWHRWRPYQLYLLLIATVTKIAVHLWTVFVLSCWLFCCLKWKDRNHDTINSLVRGETQTCNHNIFSKSSFFVFWCHFPSRVVGRSNLL